MKAGEPNAVEVRCREVVAGPDDVRQLHYRQAGPGYPIRIVPALAWGELWMAPTTTTKTDPTLTLCCPRSATVRDTPGRSTKSVVGSLKKRKGKQWPRICAELHEC